MDRQLLTLQSIPASLACPVLSTLLQNPGFQLERARVAYRFRKFDRQGGEASQLLWNPSTSFDSWCLSVVQVCALKDIANCFWGWQMKDGRDCWQGEPQWRWLRTRALSAMCTFIWSSVKCDNGKWTNPMEWFAYLGPAWGYPLSPWDRVPNSFGIYEEKRQRNWIWTTHMVPHIVSHNQCPSWLVWVAFEPS